MPRITRPFTSEQEDLVAQARQAAEARRNSVRHFRSLMLEANEMGVSVRRLADSIGEKPTSVFKSIQLAREERDHPVFRPDDGPIELPERPRGASGPNGPATIA